jgi:hypothetical protein
MKRTLLTIATVLSATALTMSQTVVRTADGNYVATSQVKAVTDSLTGSSISWDGLKQEPIYKGAKGGLYVARVSKNGKYYRKYIKTESND